MDYEKSYNEALERAKSIHNNPNASGIRKEWIEQIFPELAESEDERIRTVILKLVLGMRDEIFTTADKLVTKPKVLAWLEKQKEPHIPWYDLQKSKEAGYTILKTEEYEELIKQKEQKPADDKAFEEWIDDWWKHNKVNNPYSYDKGDEIQFDERGFKNFCREIRNIYQQKPEEIAPNQFDGITYGMQGHSTEPPDCHSRIL